MNWSCRRLWNSVSGLQLFWGMVISDNVPATMTFKTRLFWIFLIICSRDSLVGAKPSKSFLLALKGAMSRRQQSALRLGEVCCVQNLRSKNKIERTIVFPSFRRVQIFFTCSSITLRFLLCIEMDPAVSSVNLQQYCKTFFQMLVVVVAILVMYFQQPIRYQITAVMPMCWPK